MISSGAGAVADTAEVLMLVGPACAPAYVPVATVGTIVSVLADYADRKEGFAMTKGAAALVNGAVSRVVARKLPGITHGEIEEFTKAQAKWIGAVLGILATIPANLAEKAIRFSDDPCE